MSTAMTVIGDSMRIEGEIDSDHPLLLCGSVRGKVRSAERVQVAPKAAIEADIDSRCIEVAGDVSGSLTASARVAIEAEGSVTGDVRTPRITIADGGRLNGSIHMRGGE